MTEERRLAGFWIRLVADVLDTLLLTVASWVLELACLGAVYWIGRVTRAGLDQPAFFEAFNAFTLQMLNAVIYAGLAFPYYVWGHYRYGTTLGKRPFGIVVVDARTHGKISLGQSVGRCLAYVLSYVIFLGGFLMAAFHPRKQGLHDILAGTVSVRAVRAALLSLVAAGALLQAEPVRAEERPEVPVFHFQAAGSYVRVNPQAHGGELGGALLFEPLPDRFILAGPRLSVLGARSAAGMERWDLNAGVEGAVWFGNAVGSGIGLDFVGPSSYDGRRTPPLPHGSFFFDTIQEVPGHGRLGAPALASLQHRVPVGPQGRADASAQRRPGGMGLTQ